MPAADDIDAEISAGLQIASAHGLTWSDAQYRALVTAVLSYHFGPGDLPIDDAWHQICAEVQVTIALECEQMSDLLYGPRGPDEDDTLPNFAWWDTLDVGEALGFACPFSCVPEEHLSEVVRLRMSIMRGLLAADEGSV